MNLNASAGQVLARSGPLLLDFDGPVCGVFAGYPAPEIAMELCALLIGKGTALPQDIRREPDPLQILHWTMTIDQQNVIDEVERALSSAEVRAVQSAAPTPFVRELIVAAKEAGRDVAIVSNNSAPAINNYLGIHRLAHHVALVVGRTPGRPDLMKPNPAPILQAVSYLNVDAAVCVLIGDSVSDVEAAQAANVRVIGFANRPAKVSRLTGAGADAVVTSLSELATQLLDTQPGRSEM